jgi:hypothetical protein
MADTSVSAAATASATSASSAPAGGFPGGWWDPLNWFSGLAGAADSAVTGFFSDIGGKIAAAIEAGFVALFGDVWRVIVGPLEILAGALIIVVALGIAFKHDVAGIAMAAAIL